MSRIFISYRRSDASGHAGRLRDRLRARFGDDVVFQDVDNIPDGEEFAKVIERALDSCSVAIVVIGRNWVNAESTPGVRRFDDPEDWVRTEVGILLRRGIRVVPVLVQGASMPRREELPEELRGLLGRNARELRDSAWDADVALLLRNLDPVIGARRARRLWTAAAAIAIAAVVAVALYVGLNIDIGAGNVALPDVEGKTAEVAREVLAKDGFKNLHEETVHSADFGPGRVVRTDPLAGSAVAPTDKVTVFVSAGAAPGTSTSPPDATAPSPPPQGEVRIKRPVSDAASPVHPPMATQVLVPVQDRLAGFWKITQRSPGGAVTQGMMRLVVYRVDNKFANFAGEVDWSPGATPSVGDWGTAEHQAKWERGALARLERTAVEGDVVRFVLKYRDGTESTYTATVDASRNDMIGGKAVFSRGDSATWTAARVP